MLERVDSDFMQVMERDLRGDATPPTGETTHSGVDNSMALVLVPKHKVRARRNLEASMSDSGESKPIITLGGDETDAVPESQNTVPVDEDDINISNKSEGNSELEAHSAVYSKTGIPSSSKAAKFLQLSSQSDNINQSNAGSENNNQSELKPADQLVDKETSACQSIKHPGARREGRKSNTDHKQT